MASVQSLIYRFRKRIAGKPPPTVRWLQQNVCKTLGGEREPMMTGIAKPIQIQNPLIFSIQKIQNDL